MKNCNCSSVCESDDAKRSLHSSDEFFGYEEAPIDNVSSDDGSKDEMELLHYLGDNRTSISSLEDYQEFDECLWNITLRFPRQLL